MEHDRKEQFGKTLPLTPKQLLAVVKVVEKRLLGTDLELLAEFRDELGILSGFIQMPRKLPRRPAVSYDGFSGRMDADDAARVTAYRRAMDMVSRADIGFVVLQDDETLVVVSANDRDWSRLESVWSVILTELERLWPKKPEQGAQAEISLVERAVSSPWEDASESSNDEESNVPNELKQASSFTAESSASSAANMNKAGGIERKYQRFFRQKDRWKGLVERGRTYFANGGSLTQFFDENGIKRKEWYDAEKGFVKYGVLPPDERTKRTYRPSSRPK